MSTEKELELAARINDLSDAESRPVVTSGGMFAAIVNFISNRVSRGILSAALLVFIAYHGWQGFNQAQQGFANVEAARAEAGRIAAEAQAANSRIGDSTVAAAKMQAELDALTQQGIQAKAEADAQNTIVGTDTINLAGVRADLAKTQAEALQAKAESDALTQTIAGLPAALALKKSEVEAAEAEAQNAIAKQKLNVKGALSMLGQNGSPGDAIGGVFGND